LRDRRAHAISPGMVRHRILFVCLGNICRSPMAEGVFRRVVAEEGVAHLFEIDSAGLGDWHVGQAPDNRAQAAQITRGDFARFDLLLAMDGSNVEELIQLAPQSERHKIRRFLDFAPHIGAQDVPDPFFGGREGFDRALDLIEEAARGLLGELVGDARPKGKSLHSSSG
jgi:protein-tyrosine phosphatase